MRVDRVKKKRTEWRRRPDLFVRDVFGATPEEYQSDILRALAADRHARVCVRSCHGAGKTTVDAWAMAWFLIAWGPCKVVTTAPTWRQVEKILWTEFRMWITRAKKRGIDFGGQAFQTEWRYSEDWFATGLSTNDPASFEGWHSDRLLFVLDEAKGLPRWVFDSAEGLLNVGDELKMLVTSTPGVAEGKYFEAFRSEDWAPFHIKWSDVKRKGGLARWNGRRLREWGPQSSVYRSKALGEFFLADKDALISLDWVTRAREIRLKPEGPVLLGVDCAWEGDDDSAFCIRQGPCILHLDGVHGQDPMAVASRAAALIKKFGVAETTVDVIGIGAGVFARLKQLGFRVQKFKASWKARKKEQFGLYRDEAWWAVRERFREEDMIDLSRISETSYTRLLRELSGIRWDLDGMGRTIIESKRKFRKRDSELRGEDDSRSPDFADALCIAVAPRMALVFDYSGASFSAVRKSA